MINQLEKTGIDYEFVEAVDGRDLDPNDPRLVDPTLLGGNRFWSSVAGCALSHLRVYRKVLEDGLERALVLEDDTVLPTDLCALTDATAAYMKGAEVVLLNFFSFLSAQRRQPCQLSRQGSIQLPSSRILAFPVDVRDLASTGAYIITREACERMEQTVAPVRASADDWAFFCQNGALDTVRCVLPVPIEINTSFRTTIGDHAPGSMQTRLRVMAVRIPLLRQALAVRRQRIMARQRAVELVGESGDSPIPP